MLHHEIRIGTHVLVFSQQDGGYFDLRIDAESFSFVYNKIKMGDNFVYEAGENQLGEKVQNTNFDFDFNSGPTSQEEVQQPAM